MRELQAVDSEHKKNHQKDSWRIYQISKSLCRAGHVWGNFGNGNLESLTEAARIVVEKQNQTQFIEGNVNDDPSLVAKVIASAQ